MENNGSKFGIVSLVVGICSCVCAFFGIYSFLGIILGIVGIIFGVKAINLGATTSQAKAGKVLSIVGLSVCGAVWLIYIFFFGALAILFSI